MLKRAEGPEFRLCLRYSPSSSDLCVSATSVSEPVGPWRPDLYPLAEVRELVIAQLARRRHLDALLIADDLDQPAFLEVARNQDGAAIGSFSDARNGR